MDKCPPEILDQVSALACTDDGSTGRSLSLVSRRIRDISAPHKFYSIHVVSATQLARFASSLKAHQAPIQYLLLDCSIPGVETGGLDPVKNMHWDAVLLGEMKGLDQAISTILCALAPSLKGLYLNPGLIVQLRLESLTFPRLKTLYIFGALEEPSFNWTQLGFPSLCRLNLSCNLSSQVAPVGHERMIFRHTRVPTLTHLGCCSHSDAVRSMLSWLDATYRLPSSRLPGGYARNLEILRLELPGTLLEEVVPYANLGMLPLDRLKERYPKIIAVPHGRMKGGAACVPMEEWQYVVEGGIGFLTPNSNPCGY